MRKLVIPSVEEAERAASGFVPAFSRVLASIATSDGPLTTLKYNCLIEAANWLASEYEESTLPTAIIMRSLESPANFQSALKRLKTETEAVPEETKNTALEIARPLISLQGEKASDLMSELCEAFDISVDDERPVNGFDPTALRPRGFFDSIKRKIWKRDDRFNMLMVMANAYDQVEVAKEICEILISKESVDLSQIRQKCRELVSLIQADATELMNQRVTLAKTMELADRLCEVASANYRQIEQRLAALHKRVEHEKECFNEDVKDFIEDSTNEVEFVMRDRMRTDDWLDEYVWESFAKSQHGRLLQVRYGKLKNRYERQIELLKEELMIFRDELTISRPSLLSSINHKEFARLVSPATLRARFMGGVDKLTNRTLFATGIGAGSVAAAAHFVPAAAAVILPIAGPLSAVIFAPMAIAGLYKMISNPNKRKEREMRDKRKEIEAGLEEMMRGALETHNNTLNAIVDEFYKAAEWYLAPLMHSSKRAIDIVQLQDRWIQESVKNTIGVLKSLTLL